MAEPRKNKDAEAEKVASGVKGIAEIVTAVTIIGTAAVGAGTWCVSQINAGTNEKIDELSARIQDLKVDSTRNQLLTLISNYPNNEEEILKVSRHYFQDLNGDWYMTSLFSNWAKSRNIDASTILGHKK